MDDKYIDFNDLYQRNEDYYCRASDGLIDCIKEYNTYPCKALDVGCGQGRNALWLANRGFKVVAIDNSPMAIESLKQYAYEQDLHIDIILGDISTYDIGTKEFGLVVVQTTLNHLDPKSIPNCCKRIYESLKCDGIIYCIVFTTEDPGYKNQRERKSECSHLVKYYFSPGELRRRFSNLEILKYVKYTKVDDSHGPIHYHGKAKLIGKKKCPK